MPYYEYKCQNNHRYEIKMSIFDKKPDDIYCPECMELMKPTFSPPAVELKGGGFYKNSR